MLVLVESKLDLDYCFGFLVFLIISVKVVSFLRLI